MPPDLVPDRSEAGRVCAAIVLTGGRGTRLGGVDKASLTIGAHTLLDRLIRELVPATIVVVGRPAPTSVPVHFTREDPPGGGPAAGVTAGMTALLAAAGSPEEVENRADYVAILAVDHPGVTRATVGRLLDGAAHAVPRGAVLVTGQRRHYGVMVCHVAELVGQLRRHTSWHNQSLRTMLDPIIGATVPARDAEARDVDSVEDLAWWRAHVGH